MRAPRSLLFALSLLAAACSDPAPTTPQDSSAPHDVTADTARDTSGGDTAQPLDAGLDAPSDVAADLGAEVARVDVTPDLPQDVLRDAGAETAADAPGDVPTDAAPRTVTEILGTLSATCGTLRGMLHSPSPSLLENALVFTAGERWERAALSPDGQRVFDTANAGGSSGESEVMAFEVLHYCESASLLRTETEIRYAPPDDTGSNAITDILVSIGGERVGVSVTRVYRPAPMVLTDTDVRDLLVRKLEGINRSSVRVLPEDRWVKQVLSIFVVNAEVARAVSRVWATLDAATRADTVLVVTITTGGGFIYCNPDPPLGTECPSL